MKRSGSNFVLSELSYFPDDCVCFIIISLCRGSHKSNWAGGQNLNKSIHTFYVHICMFWDLGLAILGA